MTALETFISYSHKDEEFKNELENHLAMLKRQGLISTWNDRKISPGKNWKNEISENLESAQLILFLISSDFIGSDYCMEIEVQRAVEKAK